MPKIYPKNNPQKFPNSGGNYRRSEGVLDSEEKYKESSEENFNVSSLGNAKEISDGYAKAKFRGNSEKKN